MLFDNGIAAKVRKALRIGLALLAVSAIAGSLRADSPPSAPFDLAGPGIRVRVTRDGQTLPISSVASLRAGDRLWIQPDFPSNQSAHYLLIVAFLQGPTNPPPENWFTRIETWQKDAREKGTYVTVPEAAEQALLFLAPETGGGFGSLRSTVRGKPGVFVRASDDLEQASLDRTRLDKFLEEIQKPGSAPLAQRATLLSRTLAVKADPECFTKPADEQSSCLTQNTNGLTLEDTPNQSVVASLTSGATADLVGTLGGSPLAKGGYYSPYIGSALDIVRLLNTLHTAEFQYLPALVLPTQDDLNLKLNAPPSFHTPRSVLVVGLPRVEPAGLPLLHAINPAEVYCLQNPPLVLPVQGAPLVFSTGMAHDFVLDLQNKFGQTVRLPAAADAARGGFAVDISQLRPGELDDEAIGTLYGFWGFDPYEGPSFHFQNAHSAKWIVPAADAKALLAGQQDTLHLGSDGAACVESVSAEMADSAAKADPKGVTGTKVAETTDARNEEEKSDGGSGTGKGDGRTGTERSDGTAKPAVLKVTWKALKPDQIEVDLPLQNAGAGTVRLSVKQFGLASPDVVTLHTFAEAARLDSFRISAGDPQGILTGTRLDEVSGIELDGVRFVPAKLTRVDHQDSLDLNAPSAVATAALPLAQTLVAHVALKDGRILDLQTAVRPPRPRVALISKTVELGSAPSAVHLGNEDELPQDGRLSFLLKADVPEKFPHSEEIEVATTDGGSDALLSVAKGTLVLQDSQSVLAILDPLKSLGPSAFGPLRFRPVDDQGEKGDWQPLARLVRIPSLKDVRCPDDPQKPCALNGSSLFLLDSVSADPDFTSPVTVAAGYADTSLMVPRPNGTLLYIKLRDDPSVVDTVALPVFPDSY